MPWISLNARKPSRRVIDLSVMRDATFPVNTAHACSDGPGVLATSG